MRLDADGTFRVAPPDQLASGQLVVGSLVSVPFAIVSGGIACILGVGVLGALVPQFARYDARDPTP